MKPCLYFHRFFSNLKLYLIGLLAGLTLALKYEGLARFLDVLGRSSHASCVALSDASCVQKIYASCVILVNAISVLTQHVIDLYHTMDFSLRTCLNYLATLSATVYGCQIHKRLCRLSSYSFIRAVGWAYVYPTHICLASALSAAMVFYIYWPIHCFAPSDANNIYQHHAFNTGPYGGAARLVYSWDDLLPHVDYSSLDEREEFSSESQFTYHSHCSVAKAAEAIAQYPALIMARVPISILCLKLNVAQISEVARLHGMSLNRHIHVDAQRQALANHTCDACGNVATLFRRSRSGMLDLPNISGSVNHRVNRGRPKRKKIAPENLGAEEREFPPAALSQDERADIIDRFCHAFDAEAIEEVGCAVCGQLTLLAETIPLSQCKNLDLLASSADATRKM